MPALFPPRSGSPPRAISPPITSSTPRGRSRALAGNIPIDAFRRGFRRIRRSGPIWTRAPSSRLRGFDAFEETPAGLLRGVEWVPGDGSAGSRGHDGQADGLAFGVGAVELADGEAGVGEEFVGDEGGAVGAARAVVAQGEGEDGADAGEEVLIEGVLVGMVMRFRKRRGVLLGLLP